MQITVMGFNAKILHARYNVINFSLEIAIMPHKKKKKI